MSRVLVLFSFALCWVPLAACERQHDSKLSASRGKLTLSAEPNPVPAGDPDQPLGSTIINWNTGNETAGDLYVKENRSPEVFLARASSGTLKIDWIQFDSTYEFRLYAKKHSKLLTKLDVIRDN
jgi:ABC-type oligopeptide transport system substrate-binding subunit